MVRHGVYHADMNVDDMELPTLKAAVATAASWGVSLEMIHIEPFIVGGRGMACVTAAEEPGLLCRSRCCHSAARTSLPLRVSVGLR